MLSDHCLSVLSCLSVMLVHCGQMVGLIKMKLGMQVGLDPGHIVLDGKKGKEEYSAFLAKEVHSKRSGMDHTVLPANNHAWLSFVSVHQIAPPQQLKQQTSNCSLLLIYRPPKG